MVNKSDLKASMGVASVILQLGMVALIGVSAKADVTNTPSEQIVQARVDIGRSNAVTDQLTTPLTLLWKTSLLGINQDPQSPAYAGGTVYYAAGTNVYAVRATDGAALWTSTGTAAFDTSPAISGDALYVGADDAYLYKISLKDGSVLWKQNLGTEVRSSPVVANGRVFAGTNDGHVFALDPLAGAVVWSFQAGAAVSTPIAVDGRGYLLFCAGDSKLYDIDGSTGHQKWQLHFSADPTGSPPAYANDTVYVGAGQKMYALNPRTGYTKWQTQLAQGVASPAAVGDGCEFVATDDNQIVCLNSEGGQVWAAAIGSRSITAPLVIGKTLIVSTEHGVLLAYSADTGTLLWDYVLQSPGNVQASGIYADNTLYALGTDGGLAAFQAKTPDREGPEITTVSPKEDDTVLGTNIPYAATIVDVGSGVSPATVSLTLDGAVLSSARYSAEHNGLAVATGAAPAAPLSDGLHTLVIKAADWKGNTTTKTWQFSVDNSGKTVSGPYVANSPTPPAQDGNSLYPAPTDDPAERLQERRQAYETYRELMREYRQNGSNGPPPPRPPSY